MSPTYTHTSSNFMNIFKKGKFIKFQFLIYAKHVESKVASRCRLRSLCHPMDLLDKSNTQPTLRYWYQCRLVPHDLTMSRACTLSKNVVLLTKKKYIKISYVRRPYVPDNCV